MFQAVLWEIIAEANEILDLQSGTFALFDIKSVDSGGVQHTMDAALKAEAFELGQSWLNAAVGLISWDDINYYGITYGTEYDVNIDVYYIENNTNYQQTLLAATVIGPTAVPEPATMLIFGAVLGFLPLARRFRTA
jgi:hypothetical protein